MATIGSGFQRLNGMDDLLPVESRRWVRAEQAVRGTMQRFGFGEIRVPILESTVLFEKGTGAQTNVVQKEMYTFTDQGQRSVTLRPEGTPSVVRAYLEASLGARWPASKLFYIGPMFRAERPQKGRRRQFHQYGAELIGPAGPAADIELLALADTSLRDLGVTAFTLTVNSIGEADARAAHGAALREFLATPQVGASLCEDCKRRAAANPLRIFDCKKEGCGRVIAGAPTIDQYLTAEDREHFTAVCAGLKQLKIAFTVDVRMVRGLDYYTRTTFEFVTDQLGAQGTLLGGGRYDRLVELYGGPPTPAVGFAAGFERILLMTQDEESQTDPADRLDVFVCALGADASGLVPGVLSALRRLGLSADRDFMDRGLKSQMKQADRLAARYVLLFGDDEISRGEFTLRDMDRSDQAAIPADSSGWTAALFSPKESSTNAANRDD